MHVVYNLDPPFTKKIFDSHIEKSADLFHPPALRITGIGQNWRKICGQKIRDI